MSTEQNDSEDALQRPDEQVTRAQDRRHRRVRTVLLFLLVAISFAALAYFIRQPKTSPSATSATQGAEKSDYYCPMHKSYHSDKPGNCPICSMKLVKLEKAPATSGQTTAQTMAGMPMGETEQPPAAARGKENAVFIAPQKQQLIGMRSVAASVSPLMREIRAVGKVAFDETRVTHIHTKVSGYIEEVYANYIGKPSSRQAALVQATIAKLQAGAEIVAAFDADDAGRKLVEMIREIVAGVTLRTGRSDLIFETRLPADEGEDWNQVLQNAGLDQTGLAK